MTFTAQETATIVDPSIPADTAGWLTWAAVPGSFTATADPQKLLYTAPTGRRFIFEGAGTARLSLGEEGSDAGLMYVPGCGPYESGSRESVIALFEDTRFLAATMETYAGLEARLGVGENCEVNMLSLDGSSSEGFDLGTFFEVLRDGEIQGDEDDEELIYYDYPTRRLCMTIGGTAPSFDPPEKVEQLRGIIQDTATTPVIPGSELEYLHGVMDALLAGLLQHPDTPEWVHEGAALR